MMTKNKVMCMIIEVSFLIRVGTKITENNGEVLDFEFTATEVVLGIVLVTQE